MNPEVSVILAFYKEGKVLESAIESVLSQTFQSWELILVDNNATSETRYVADSYAQKHPDRIRVYHEPEQGICSARNRGILEAKGEFIACLDGDDLMKPERLRRQYDVLSSRPDLALVGCHYDLLSFDGTRILEYNIQGFAHRSQNILEWKSYLQALYRPLNLPHQKSFDLFAGAVLFFRKKDAVEVGLFNTLLNPRDLDDFEFCLRMFERGGFELIPEPLQFYRAESSETRSTKYKDKNTKKALMKLQIFFSILWERYGKNFPENHRIFRRLQAFHLINFGSFLMRCSHGKEIGASFIRRGLLADPLDIRNWKWALKTFFPKRFHKRFFDYDFEDEEYLDFDKNFSDNFLRWPLDIFKC